MSAILDRYIADTASKGKILHLHSDGETAFVGTAQRTRLEARGICVTWTVPGESDQNSGAERPIYGVQKMVRGYLFDSGLPVTMWAYIAIHAVQVRKVLPRYRKYEDRHYTSLGLIYGERPYVGHLQRIGCVAHGHIKKQDRADGHFGATCFSGFFLGFARYQRGAHIWCPSTHVVRVCYSVQYDPDRVYGNSSRYSHTERLLQDATASLPHSAEDLLSGIIDAPVVLPPLDTPRAPADDEIAPIDMPVNREPVNRRLGGGDERYPSGKMRLCGKNEVRPLDGESHRAEAPVSARLRSRATSDAPAAQGFYTPIEGEFSLLFEDCSFEDALAFSVAVAHGSTDETDCRTTILWEWDIPALSARFKTKTVRTKQVKMEAGGTFEEIRLPRNMKEVMNHKYKDLLMEAAQKEYDSHVEAGTWELVARSSIPPGRSTVGSTWASDVKMNTLREFVKFKMRLCGQGFSQRPGFDYDESYSSTIPFGIFRLFLSICAHYCLEVTEADYATAYLNARLMEEIWMEQPEGFARKGPNGESPADTVCLLRRAIYGLVQSGREWQNTHHAVLRQVGWEQCPVEACLFRYTLQTGVHAYMVTWVDNLFLGFPPHCEERGSCLAAIKNHFKLSDLGPLSYSLGAQIVQDLRLKTISLSQEHYIATLGAEYAADFITYNVSPSRRSVPATESLYDVLIGEPDSIECREWVPQCQRLAGQLRFLADVSRFDICASLSWASRHVLRATSALYVALLRILCHCVETRQWKLTYGPGQDQALREWLILYSNIKIDPWDTFDYFLCCDSSHGPRPLLCVLIVAGGTAIDWHVCRAGPTTLSSTQSEWYAMTVGTTSVMAHRPIMEFFGLNIRFPVLLFDDSSTAIQLSLKDAPAKSMKHAVVRLEFLQDCVSKGLIINPVWIDGTHNPADIGTKILVGTPFHDYRQLFLRA